VKTILGVPLLFAYNMLADMPEDLVYKMLNSSTLSAIASPRPIRFSHPWRRLRRHAG